MTFEMTRKSEPYRNKKFKRASFVSNYNVKHNLGDFQDLLQVCPDVDSSFSSLLERELDGRDPNDMFSCTIKTNTGKEIYISPQLVRDRNPQEFLNSIYAVAQSDHDVLLENMEIQFIIVESPSKSGK